jgi:quercetin dioxygenase-like cupin family protein
MDDNSPEKVRFREDILRLQDAIPRLVENGELGKINCRTTHHFSPQRDGFTLYAREFWAAKGSVIVGKIHKYSTINFIMQGSAFVAAEYGDMRLVAPMIFVSPPNAKRALLVEQDITWATVHLTKFQSEDDMDKMEDELIAPSYESIGLLASIDQLKLGEPQ